MAEGYVADKRPLETLGSAVHCLWKGSHDVRHVIPIYNLIAQCICIDIYLSAPLPRNLQFPYYLDLHIVQPYIPFGVTHFGGEMWQIFWQILQKILADLGRVDERWGQMMCRIVIVFVVNIYMYLFIVVSFAPLPRNLQYPYLVSASTCICL
jgi:hypothetical protein